MEREAQAKTEQERVFASRMDRFLALGFTEIEAELLADSDIDWHYVDKRLLQRGCCTALAFEIAI